MNLEDMKIDFIAIRTRNEKLFRAIEVLNTENLSLPPRQAFITAQAYDRESIGDALNLIEGFQYPNWIGFKTFTDAIRQLKRQVIPLRFEYWPVKESKDASGNMSCEEAMSAEDVTFWGVYVRAQITVHHGEPVYSTAEWVADTYQEVDAQVLVSVWNKVYDHKGYIPELGNNWEFSK